MSDECKFDAEHCETHSQIGGPYHLHALCTHAAAALQAERDKYRRYPFEPICLICGALEPCMTEADLKPDDPGVPCTFDPTPKQLFEENANLRDRVRELERPLGAEAGRALLADYPNLRAIVDGTVSGSIAEWPQMRVELLRFLGQYCDRIYRAEAKKEKS